MSGKMPFKGDSQMEKALNVSTGNYEELDDNFSKEARELIG